MFATTTVDTATAHYTPQHHYARSPNQPLNQTHSTISISGDVID
jgi:hypothetical protein